jgi:xylose isomerase
MNISNEQLQRLSQYSGYIEGDQIDQFFADFGIQFGAGHWCGGEFSDRFAPGGYNSNDPTFEKGVLAEMKRVHQAKIKGIEFTDSSFIQGGTAFGAEGDLDDELVETVKQKLDEYSLVPVNMNINTWSHPKWKFGGITNPDPAVRRDAIDLCLAAAELGKARRLPQFAAVARLRRLGLQLSK